MVIRTVTPDLAPLALLLTADPCLDRVRKYLGEGTTFVGEEGNVVVAVAVLEWKGIIGELKNIAVVEDQRSRGLGRGMLHHVMDYARLAGVRQLDVGTGNSSLSELAFYQRNGFRIVSVIAGFFESYDPPIIENGIACRDMIRLAIDLENC